MGATFSRARAGGAALAPDLADTAAVAASRLMVDRLLRLRADRASGRLTPAQFVEQRLHLLDRRREDVPFAGPDRRRRTPTAV